MTDVVAGFEDAAGVEIYAAILNGYGGIGWEVVGAASSPGQEAGRWVAVFCLKRRAG